MCGFICERYYINFFCIISQHQQVISLLKRGLIFDFCKPKGITHPLLPQVESVINVSDMSSKEPVVRCGIAHGRILLLHVHGL